MTEETANEVSGIAKGVLAAGQLAAPFVPNAVAQAALILAAKYGPQVIDQIIAALSKQDVNLNDIKAIFAGLQPYEAFGIPDSPPVVAAAPEVAPATETISPLPQTT